jgi:hypothetical protein
MQCPGCGYEADDEAFFCPQCRFQFRDVTAGPAATGNTVTDLPERDVITTESIAEESIFEERQKAFTAKELRQLEVQLIQPALIIVLIVALFTYTVISTVPFLPVTLAGLNFGVTGLLCLACGLFSGMVFFFLSSRSLTKFRYR